MSANDVERGPNWSFVSMTGPTLDNISAKTMRAHTTRANFARRRLRLMREYAAQKERPHPQTQQPNRDVQTPFTNRPLDTRLLVMSRPGLDQALNHQDDFFITHCASQMDLCIGDHLNS